MRDPHEQPGQSLDSYVEGWRSRAQTGAAEHRARSARLRLALDEVAERLNRDFAVRRVVLFGSLARGEGRAGSDVDLLVEGLDPARIIEASVMADRILREAHVDIVPAELARPEIRRRAEEEGEVIRG
jgi:predicted nucleotidyltransferase